MLYRLRSVAAPYLARRFDRTRCVDTFGQQSVSMSRVSGPSTAHAYGFGSIPEKGFRLMLERLPVELESAVFIDLGCGKGRALFIAAEYPFTRVIGVEYAEDLAEIARQNLRTLQPADLRKKIALYAMDAVQFDYPADAPCLVFLYSPFDGPVLQNVLGNIAASHKRAPRPVFLCYARQNSARSKDHREEIARNTAFAQFGDPFTPFDIGALPDIQFTLFRVDTA